MRYLTLFDASEVLTLLLSHKANPLLINFILPAQARCELPKFNEIFEGVVPRLADCNELVLQHSGELVKIFDKISVGLVLCNQRSILVFPSLHVTLDSLQQGIYTQLEFFKSARYGLFCLLDRGPIYDLNLLE